MKTEDLIRALSADPQQEAAPSQVLVWLVPVAAALSFAGLVPTLGLRADIGHALTSLVPLWRHILTLALFGLALWAALATARPGAKARLWPLLVVAGGAGALWLWSLLTTPAEGWGMALQGKTQMVCLVSIPLLSVLPVAALMAALRQGASTTPALSGALAGLAGSGLGAAIYALHCIEDSPLFYVTWYGTAILGVTALSALIGHRLLRW